MRERPELDRFRRTGGPEHISRPIQRFLADLFARIDANTPPRQPEPPTHRPQQRPAA